MPFSLPRLYPITSSSLSQLSHADQVRQFIAGGATLVQVREKSLPSGPFCDQALEAVSVAANKSVRVIVNDRVDVAMVASAAGVHLGQDDIPVPAARGIL